MGATARGKLLRFLPTPLNTAGCPGQPAYSLDPAEGSSQEADRESSSAEWVTWKVAHMLWVGLVYVIKGLACYFDGLELRQCCVCD